MEYLPRNSKSTESFHYQLMESFNFVITENMTIDEIYDSNSFINESHSSTVPLSKGDIIEIKPFTGKNSNVLYYFLVKVIRNEKELFINSESFITKDFIEVNKWIFVNVTKQFLRDDKINKIFN